MDISWDNTIVNKNTFKDLLAIGCGKTYGFLFTLMNAGPSPFRQFLMDS